MAAEVAARAKNHGRRPRATFLIGLDQRIARVWPRVSVAGPLSSRRSQNINLKLRNASVFGDVVSTKLTIRASTPLPTYTGTGMSQRTTRLAQAARSQHSPHHPGQIRAAPSVHDGVRVAAYTIGHAFWIAVGTVVIMA